MGPRLRGDDTENSVVKQPTLHHPYFLAGAAIYRGGTTLRNVPNG